jgi:hypothetical protein
MKTDEPLHPLDPPGGTAFSAAWALPRKRQGGWIGGIQVRSIENSLRSVLLASLRVLGRAQPRHHASRAGADPVTFGKHFDCGLEGVVEKKLGSPGEQLRFAALQFCGALIVLDALEWAAAALFDFGS